MNPSLIEDNILKNIYQLAHENNVSVQEMMAKVKETFHISLESVTTPVEKNGEIERVYPNGDVSVPLDLTNEEEMFLFRAAAIKEIPLNQFMDQAIRAVIDEEKAKNPEKFKDINL